MEACRPPVRNRRIILFITLLIGAVLPLETCAADALAKAPKIKFSAKHGLYSAPFRATISSENPDARILFTTNGSAPSPDTGHVYSGPLAIKTTTILRAAGFREGRLVTEID